MKAQNVSWGSNCVFCKIPVYISTHSSKPYHFSLNRLETFHSKRGSEIITELRASFFGKNMTWEISDNPFKCLNVDL